jgi:adenylate kinase family enzyme
VAVIGSSGSGKTTVSAELARALHCPHVELNGIYHQPDWTPLDPTAFSRRVAQAIAGPTWVVDGNYSGVRTDVWERADTVVFLNLPRSVVLARVTSRTVMRAIKKTELWNGNVEPFRNLWSVNPEKSVIAWSLWRHSLYRERYRQAIVDPRWSHLQFIQLCTSTQVAQFLKNTYDLVGQGGAV